MPVGPVQLGLIALVTLVIFGAGRLGGARGALGKGIGDFRRGVTRARMEQTEPRKEGERSA